MSKGKKNPARAARARAANATDKTAKLKTKRPDVEVQIGPEAQDQFDGLPLPIQARMRAVFIRLKRWPDVSGAKRLRGDHAGSFRIRTGDYRVVVKPLGETMVIVWKIGDRKDVYQEQR